MSVNRIPLPPKLDTDNAELLCDTLLGERGHDLILDAKDLRFCGTLCLQVLLAAHKQWAEDENSLTFASLSDDIRTAFGLLGVDETIFENGAAQCL